MPTGINTDLFRYRGSSILRSGLSILTILTAKPSDNHVFHIAASHKLTPYRHTGNRWRLLNVRQGRQG